MNVSVIIPTRNRSRRLQATLAAVSRQAFPGGHVEVIVVDDGSDDETPLVARALAMPGVEYVRQPHGGACAARNKGAASARGQLLVFVDDDVELMPDAIAMLAAAHRHCPGAVVFGRLVRPEPANRYERLQVFPEPDVVSGDTRVDCTQCLTGLLSIGREEFFALGQFQDPTGGWPSWDDIAFGYRALNAGIALVRTSDARGVHHDESSSSLQGTARRWQAASEAAIRLFSRYPDLQDRFPFYRDKLPIAGAAIRRRSSPASSCAAWSVPGLHSRSSSTSPTCSSAETGPPG